MVMGDDLFLRGRGFKSWHSILDGPVYYHIDLLLKLYCLFEKSENKQKEARVCPFVKCFCQLIHVFISQRIIIQGSKVG